MYINEKQLRQVIRHQNAAYTYASGETRYFDHFNPVRKQYTAWRRVSARIDLLTGWLRWQDLADWDHPLRDKHIMPNHVEHIMNYIPDTNNWQQIRKNIKNKVYVDEHGYQPDLTKYWVWTANLHNHQTYIPQNIYDFIKNILPYFKKIYCTEYILCLCLQVTGHDYQWIPCAATNSTKRKVKRKLQTIINDYSFKEHRFLYSHIDIPPPIPYTPPNKDKMIKALQL